MGDKEKVKNEMVFRYGYITCAVACAHIFIFSLFSDSFEWAILIPLTALCLLLGLWTLHNYKRLARWHNQRHARFHVKGGVAGEPSAWLLFSIRLEGWILIIVGLALPIITMSYLHLI